MDSDLNMFEIDVAISELGPDASASQVESQLDLDTSVSQERLKSFVWNHFVKVEDNKAKCKHCRYSIVLLFIK
jgi:BED zinc finger